VSSVLASGDVRRIREGKRIPARCRVQPLARSRFCQESLLKIVIARDQSLAIGSSLRESANTILRELTHGTASENRRRRERHVCVVHPRPVCAPGPYQPCPATVSPGATGRLL
jgi:hypothetical protein